MIMRYKSFNSIMNKKLILTIRYPVHDSNCELCLTCFVLILLYLKKFLNISIVVLLKTVK